MQSLLSLDGGRAQALEGYASAASSAGDDLRIHNGLYLTNLKLGRGETAAAAFGKIVEDRMARNRFAINFYSNLGAQSLPRKSRRMPITRRG